MCRKHLIIISALFVFVVGEIALKDIQSTFLNERCIDGEISVTPSGIIFSKSPTKTLTFVASEERSQNTQAEVVSNSGKSVLSLLNELTVYNGLDKEFRLINEDGPPHKKKFTVLLEIGSEEYVAEASSIKEAQRAAASHALRNTAYNHPPIKVKEKYNGTDSQVCYIGEEGCSNEQKLNADSKNPVSQVYEGAAKRKLDVSFEVVEESGPPHLREFVVQCKVGDLSTVGKGAKKKTAKQDAAEKMLTEFVNLPPTPDMFVSKKGLRKAKNLYKKRKRSPLKSYRSFSLKNLKKELLKMFPTETSASVKKSSNRFKGKLLNFAQILNIQIQFYDLTDEDSKHLSVVSLGTTPNKICYGQGADKNTAEDDAAIEAFHVLRKLHPDKVENAEFIQYIVLSKDSVIPSR